MPAPFVSFVSLWRPKALVDSDRIITRLRAEGYEVARKPAVLKASESQLQLAAW